MLNKHTMKRNVGIFIFDDAEVLDFSGPFEVFSVASELHEYSLFDVFTVAQNTNPITAVNGLSVNPKYDFNSAPPIDILIIAGGGGTKSLINNEEVLNWVKRVHDKSELTLSICSGARVLGKLGLLDEKEYATHHLVYDHLAEIAPKGIPVKSRRYVQTGKIYTSGGISAGIDLSFHVLDILHGKAIAKTTADYMEYKLEAVS